MKLEQKIYKILIQHTEKCKAHKMLTRMLKPFIAIDPKEKAKELAKEIRNDK